MLVPFKIEAEAAGSLLGSGVCVAHSIYLRARVVEVRDDMVTFEVDVFGISRRLNLPRSCVVWECLPYISFDRYNDFLNFGELNRRLRDELVNIKSSGGDGRLAVLAEYIWACNEIVEASASGDYARRIALYRFYGVEPKEGQINPLWQKALDLAREVLEGAE